MINLNVTLINSKANLQYLVANNIKEFLVKQLKHLCRELWFKKNVKYWYPVRPRHFYYRSRYITVAVSLYLSCKIYL